MCNSSRLILTVQKLPGLQGQREGAGPAAGLQVRAGPPALGQGEPQAGDEAEEERDRGEEERHGVLRQLHQDRTLQVPDRE